MNRPNPSIVLVLLAAAGVGCSDLGIGGGSNNARRAVTLTGDDGTFVGSDDPCSDDDSSSDDSGDTGDDDSSDDSPCDDDDSSDDDDADLPYDVRPQLGEVFQLEMAFLEEGPLPAAILSVTMEGDGWRLYELQSNTPFTVDQADCDHEGNRDIGRDRIEITWANADGSEDSDHLDIRYCKE